MHSKTKIVGIASIRALMCAAAVSLCAPVTVAHAASNTSERMKTVNMSFTASRTAFDRATDCLRNAMTRTGSSSYFDGFGNRVPMANANGLLCNYSYASNDNGFRATVESGGPDLYPEQNRLPGKIYMRVDGKVSDGTSGGYRVELNGQWRKRNLAGTAFVIGELKQSFLLQDAADTNPKEIKTEESVYSCKTIDETCGPASKDAQRLSDDDLIQASSVSELFAEVKNFAAWSAIPKRPATVLDSLSYMPPAAVEACFDQFFDKTDLKLVDGGPYKGMVYTSYHDVRCTGSFVPDQSGVRLSLLATTDAALKSGIPPAGSVLFTSTLFMRPGADGKTAAIDMHAIADTARDGGTYLNGIMRQARAVADAGTKKTVIVNGRQIYIRHPVTPANDRDFVQIDMASIGNDEARDHARLSDWLDSLASMALNRVSAMGGSASSQAKRAQTLAPGG